MVEPTKWSDGSRILLEKCDQIRESIPKFWSTFVTWLLVVVVFCSFQTEVRQKWYVEK